MLVCIYFNQRALSRANAHPSASDWDGFMASLDAIPDLGDEDATSLTDAYEQAVAADDACCLQPSKRLIPEDLSRHDPTCFKV